MKFHNQNPNIAQSQLLSLPPSLLACHPERSEG